MRSTRRILSDVGEFLSIDPSMCDTDRGHRLAIAEEIPIKYLCYSILVKATQDPSLIQSSTIEAVLEIYDKFLQDERLPAECVVVNEIPADPSPHMVLYNPEGDARCGFCKTSLFSLRLRCLGKGDCATASGSFSVCVACYGEGRACECRCMVLETSRRFSDLIAVRNNASAVIEPMAQQ